MTENHESADSVGTGQAPPNTARMFLHAIVAIGIVAAALVGVNILFSTAPKVQKRTRPPSRAVLVEVVRANATSVDSQIRASGLSSAVERLDLIPQVQGKITALSSNLVPGSIVAKNDLLASIERADYQLALDRARTTVAQAKASLALESGNQDLAKLESEYLGDLVTDDNRNLVLRRPQLESAKANLDAANVALREAQLDLARTRITAPFDALVLSRDAAIGRMVTQQTPIATLAGIDTWWIRAEVPIEILGQLRAGAAATISLPTTWGEQTRRGTVVRAQGQVEEQGRLGSVLIEIRDPLARNHPEEPAMLLGIRYDVALTGDSIPGAMALEPGWIRGEDQVWVMNESDELVVKTVEIAQRSSEVVVVKSGLLDGDRIVTSRLASPVPGMKLRVDSASPEAEAKTKPGTGAPKARE